MVGDVMMAIPMSVSMSMMNSSMEVVENIEPRKVVAGAPEWTGHPRVEIVIVGWWKVIGNHRRSFRIVVIVEDRGFRIFRSCGISVFSVTIRNFGNDR
jgi:hypothetical protein